MRATRRVGSLTALIPRSSYTCAFNFGVGQGGGNVAELVGVEGTGSHGAGLTRHLLANEVVVVEVDRPNGQLRWGNLDTTFTPVRPPRRPRTKRGSDHPGGRLQIVKRSSRFVLGAEHNHGSADRLPLCHPLTASTNFAGVSIDTASGNVAVSDGLSIINLQHGPVVEIGFPGNGSSLTGSQTLGAYASSGVNSVKFYLTGGTYNNTLIAAATATIYGWLATWNTTSVPNGSYSLQSVVMDSSGASGTSDPVTITVNN